MESTVNITENGNGLVIPQNYKKLHRLNEDHLYHLALDTQKDDLEKMFGDVRFVCFGGQPSRMEKFSAFVAEELKINDHEKDGDRPKNYASGTDRYSIHKVGPVLSVSHGIGIPSLSVVFNEIIKLIYYAKCKDVEFFRIGTCGGVGLEPGSVVVTDKAVDGEMNPYYKLTVLGKPVKRLAKVDQSLVESLLRCQEPDDEFQTVKGTTLCADDFYEGQARLDGAFCEYEEEDKMKFLQDLKEKGIRNIEMESLGFLAMCHFAGVKGAVACVTLLDRLKEDTLSCDVSMLKKWQERPQILVLRHIKKKLNKH
ncbi:uridine phosphorylase 1-like [Saccostrea cucullata]|uniref:uridine phosphorylase 1-like n=1 Tax=Saccostrea cuccullata TaxID=36930 RepID=UPI002ED50584